MSLAKVMKEIAVNRLPHLAGEEYVKILPEIKVAAFEGRLTVELCIHHFVNVQKLETEGFVLTLKPDYENRYIIGW